MGCSGIKHFGDVRVIHERERLPLGFETCHELPRVHARLNDLQGNLAPDGFLLFSHEDDAEATFADLLDQLVGADLGPNQTSFDSDVPGALDSLDRRLQKATLFLVHAEQRLHARLQLPIFSAGLLDKDSAGLWRFDPPGKVKDFGFIQL
jgi:hypothetical protein